MNQGRVGRAAGGVAGRSRPGANVSYNGTIAPGTSTVIGFQAVHTGNTAAPTGFTLNGVSCSTA